MKIKEILSEIVDTKVKQRKMKVPFDLKKLLKKEYNLPSNYSQGAYVSGRLNPRDPGVFHTISHYPMNLKNDAKLNYILAIRKFINNNPYLPRTYMVDLQRDSTGLVKPKYSQEQLIDPKKSITLWSKGEEIESASVSTESILDMGERLFPNLESDYDKLRNLLERNKERNDSYEDREIRYLAWNYLTTEVARMLQGEIDSTDPKLNQVREILLKLMHKNSNFKIDMHNDNLMLRITNKGPQLVITDPLYDRGFQSQIKSR